MGTLTINNAACNVVIFYPEYGLLYNWYTVIDERNISSSDDWVFANRTQILLLTTNAGGFFTGAYNVKESGTTHWNTDNGTNTTGFNSRGNGNRDNLGEFNELKIRGRFCYKNGLSNGVLDVRDNVYEFTDYGSYNYKIGEGIRLLYTGSGTPTSYTGNDGKVYRIVTIGAQTWLADNLSETRFRNGDIIPWYGANPANYFTNAEWAALTTSGVCAYDNDVNNVATGFSFPT